MTRPRRSQAQQSGLAGHPAAGSARDGSAASRNGSGAFGAGYRFPGQGQPVDAADEPYLPEPWVRHIGWPVFGALAALGALLLTGVPLWRSVVIALSAGIVLYLVVRSMAVEGPEWPYDVSLEPSRPSTTWEVVGLEGSRERGSSFQRYLRPRLSELSRELLRRRGIDPDSARAAALLGREATLLLSGDESAARPDSGAISRLCMVIARLAVDPIPGTPTPIRDPALRGLTGGPGRRSRSVELRTDRPGGLMRRRPPDQPSPPSREERP